MPRRNSGNQERKPPADENAAQREKLVLELRLQGLEFDDIAVKAGYANRSGAYKAWRRALARIPESVAQEARKESEMRLNVALAAIWAEIKKGNNWAIDRLIALEERRAKLLGLDAKGDAVTPPQFVLRDYPAGVVEAV